MSELKEYDNKLIFFIIFNIIVSFYFNNPNTFTNNYGIISIILTTSFFYLPIYLVKNIFPREWKFRILYPQNESHRFAYGVFSRLKFGKLKYDKKLIDLELILKKYDMPKTKLKEDDLWYEIYEKHKDKNKIHDQNKQFLMCRDYTIIILIITITFIILYLTISILGSFFGFKYFILSMIILGIMEFFIFYFLARHNNKLLALYVLQEETNDLKK